MGKLRNDLRKKRKSNENKNYELTEETKKIWAELRQKDTEQLRREQLIDKIIESIKDNFVAFVRKHDTVRVLESLIQYANDKQKSIIFEELKDSIIELSKMKYGKFFVLKMLKYGSTDQKNKIVSSFYGNVTNLMNHACASSVLETIYNDIADLKQRNELVQEYYGPEFKFFKDQKTGYLKEALDKLDDSKKERIMNHLKEQLNKLSSKVASNFSMSHYLFREFFKNAKPEDRHEMAQSLSEKVVEILHTKDGSRVGLHTIWNGSAKERKTILKSFKKFVANTAIEENGHYVLLAIFDCIDDTKMVEKFILNELFSNENILKIATNKYGRKVLEYLLSPRDTRFFHPDEIAILAEGDSNLYSKKSSDIRRKELKQIALPHLISLCTNHFSELIENGSCNLVYNILTNSDEIDKKEAFIKIVEHLANLGELNDDHDLIKKKDFDFLIKKLIQADKTKVEEDENYKTFSSILIEKLPKNILKSYSNCNKGCFYLLLILETKIQSIKESLIKILDSETMKKIKKLSTSSQGAKLLLKKLSEK